MGAKGNHRCTTEAVVIIQGRGISSMNLKVEKVVKFWIGIALKVKLPGFADKPDVGCKKEG